MKRHHEVYYTALASPVGEWLVVANNEGLQYVGLNDAKYAWNIESHWQKNEAFMSVYVRELTAYFDGSLKQFSLAVNPQGTDFQKLVWQGLTKIPYGETWSYKQLAEFIGKPKAVRAVGAANGRNPISIVIPCHRVIGQNGTLTGYAGGLDVKKHLLQLESKIPYLI